MKYFIVDEDQIVRINNRSYLITVIPDTEDGGYVCECSELSGCFSQGESKKEAIANMRTAITDWLGEEKPQQIQTSI